MKRLNIIQSVFAELLNSNPTESTKKAAARQLEELLDIELSETQAEGLLSSTVTEALQALEELLGPEEPTDGVIILTDLQFIRRYKPETTPEGEYYRQREWYDQNDIPELRRAVSENRCWTMVDDDDGNPCIDWGNHVVNRIYNIITERPIEDPEWIVQVPSEDDELYDEEES